MYFPGSLPTWIDSTNASFDDGPKFSAKIFHNDSYRPPDHSRHRACVFNITQASVENRLSSGAINMIPVHAIASEGEVEFVIGVWPGIPFHRVIVANQSANLTVRFEQRFTVCPLIPHKVSEQRFGWLRQLFSICESDDADLKLYCYHQGEIDFHDGRSKWGASVAASSSVRSL